MGTTQCIQHYSHSSISISTEMPLRMVQQCSLLKKRKGSISCKISQFILMLLYFDTENHIVLMTCEEENVSHILLELNVCHWNRNVIIFHKFSTKWHFHLSVMHTPQLTTDAIWVRSRRCGCLVTWFCYQLIAKPGNETDPYGNSNLDHYWLR